MSEKRTHRKGSGFDTSWAILGVGAVPVTEAEGMNAQAIAAIMMKEMLKGIKRADHMHLPRLVMRSHDVATAEQCAITAVAFARVVVTKAQIPTTDNKLDDDKVEAILAALVEGLRRAEVRLDAKDYSVKLYDEMSEIFYFQGRTSSDWGWKDNDEWEEELTLYEERIGIEGMGFEVVASILK